MKVNTGSGVWKDGQPKIKVDGVWKDSNKNFVKEDGLWKDFSVEVSGNFIYEGVVDIGVMSYGSAAEIGFQVNNIGNINPKVVQDIPFSGLFVNTISAPHLQVVTLNLSGNQTAFMGSLSEIYINGIRGVYVPGSTIYVYGFTTSRFNLESPATTSGQWDVKISIN